MKNILVIEEDAFLRENLVELLELHQFKVIPAKDGKTGYELAKKKIPDIIVCDLMTPQSNGKLFLDLAGADLEIRLVPILLFSFNQSEPEIKSVFKNQHDECLKKPFSEKKLLSVLNKLSLH